MRTDAATGLDGLALRRLTGAIEQDVAEERYDGAVLIVARGGEIALHEAIGYAHRPTGRPAARDDVFRIFSTTKAFTNVLALAAIDRGQLALTTKVVEVVPEFRAKDRFRGLHRERITVADLLTHRSAMPSTPYPVALERLGDLSETVAAICAIDPIGLPGQEVDYSPTINHALLGEIARRVLGDGETSYREVMRRELLDPLGMTDTAIGAPSAWSRRLVPVRAVFQESSWLRPEDLEMLNELIDERAEMPWVGAVSTTRDLFRFAEMLRRGGELDGVRILSRATLELATTNHTGTLLNKLYAGLAEAVGWEPWPANVGLGFMLRGPGLHHTMFGTLASPRTFGNYGAGSSLIWVDPVRDITFVCLTAGALLETTNIQRFQRLSDLALASAL
jgi:CubicO group peptidase (beta-lactamase class C family)